MPARVTPGGMALLLRLFVVLRGLGAGPQWGSVARATAIAARFGPWRVTLRTFRDTARPKTAGSRFQREQRSTFTVPLWGDHFSAGDGKFGIHWNVTDQR